MPPRKVPQDKRKRCEPCGTEVFAHQWARHCATAKHKKSTGGIIPPMKARKEGSGKDKGVKPGVNFFITFTKLMKYQWLETANRHQKYFEKYIKSYIIGNEWGVGGLGHHAHSHMIIIMKEPHTLVQMQKIIKGLTKEVANDIQSCKNVKNAVAYCSKEDVRCAISNMDLDWLSLVCLAWKTANRNNFTKLNITSYPCCRLMLAQQKQFMQYYEVYRQEDRADKMQQEFQLVELRRWQKAAIKMLNIQTNRQVLWIHEPVGNVGKSYLGLYLKSMNGAIVMHNSTINHMAYAYNEEPIVVFDLTRTGEASVNYDFIECLKTGIIFSTKYESHMKSFAPPKVIVFANYPPAKHALSVDRLMIFQVVNDALILDLDYHVNIVTKINI